MQKNNNNLSFLPLPATTMQAAVAAAAAAAAQDTDVSQLAKLAGATDHSLVHLSLPSMPVIQRGRKKERKGVIFVPDLP